jgi:hypothetical protein
MLRGADVMDMSSAMAMARGNRHQQVGALLDMRYLTQ